MVFRTFMFVCGIRYTIDETYAVEETYAASGQGGRSLCDA